MCVFGPFAVCYPMIYGSQYEFSRRVSPGSSAHRPRSEGANDDFPVVRWVVHEGRDED